MDMPVQQQTILALMCGLPTVMSESLAQATDGFSDPGCKNESSYVQILEVELQISRWTHRSKPYHPYEVGFVVQSICGVFCFPTQQPKVFM